MSGRKTLLPELLPDPRPRPAEGPRERVTARARLMLERLAGLKTAAGAAVLAAHCGGYGVVDPLPPPPMQCTKVSDPFARLWITGGPERTDAGAADASFTIASSTSFGYQIDAVRVTAGGTLIGVEDQHAQNGSGFATDFAITILPDGAGGPILFEVDLSCGGATTTRHYQATLDGLVYNVVDLD